MNLNIKLTVFVLLLVVFRLTAESPEIGKPAPEFTLTDSEGKVHKLSDYRGKYVVLEWVNYGCPFVQKHYNSGNMQKLQKSYTEKGIVWFSVCSSAPGKQGNFSAKKIQELKAEKKAAYSAYLVDADGKTGRAYEAKTTPHMFIIDPAGNLVYGGAIDDKKTTDTEDVKTARNYVSEILDAAVAGNKFKSHVTTPYGCGIKY